MSKGILLEVRGRQGIVLTPQGEFRSVRLAHPGAVGDEVEYSELPGRPQPRWVWGAVAAAAVLVALAVAAPGLWLPAIALGTPVAMVSVDINPSMELLVDSRERVTGVRARNADGEELLAAVRHRGRAVTEVVVDLTTVAVERGFLRGDDPEATVVVAVVPLHGGAMSFEAEDHLVIAVAAAAEQAVQAVQSGRPAAATVMAVPASVEQRDRAEELGTTPGRLALAEAILSVAPAELHLTLETALQTPPGQLRKQIRLQSDWDPLPQMEQELKGKKAKERSQNQEGDDAGRRPGSGADPQGRGVSGDDGRGSGNPGDVDRGRGANGGSAPGQGRGLPGSPADRSGPPGPDRPAAGQGEVPGDGERQRPGRDGGGQGRGGDDGDGQDKGTGRDKGGGQDKGGGERDRSRGNQDRGSDEERARPGRDGDGQGRGGGDGDGDDDRGRGSGRDRDGPGRGQGQDLDGRDRGNRAEDRGSERGARR